LIPAEFSGIEEDLSFRRGAGSGNKGLIQRFLQFSKFPKGCVCGKLPVRKPKAIFNVAQRLLFVGQAATEQQHSK